MTPRAELAVLEPFTPLDFAQRFKGIAVMADLPAARDRLAVA